MDLQSFYNLSEAYSEVYSEERRSPEERKARGKELGDRQTVRKVVDKYNKGRSETRKEDPEKYYTKEESLYEVSDRKVKAVRNAREKQWNRQWKSGAGPGGLPAPRVQDPTDDMVNKIDKLIDQRNKRTGSKVKKTSLRNEEVTKEEVIGYLMDEGFVNNEVSAEVFIEHMSDEWIETIIEKWERPNVGKMQKQAERHRNFAFGGGSDTAFKRGPKGEDPSTMAIRRSNKMGEVMNSPKFDRYQAPKSPK